MGGSDIAQSLELNTLDIEEIPHVHRAHPADADETDANHVDGGCGEELLWGGARLGADRTGTCGGPRPTHTGYASAQEGGAGAERAQLDQIAAAQRMSLLLRFV